MNIKYLPRVFEGIYVLEVSNLLEDLLYKDIPPSFMFTTHDIILTKYDIQILFWIHGKKEDFAMKGLILKQYFYEILQKYAS